MDPSGANVVTGFYAQVDLWYHKENWTIFISSVAKSQSYFNIVNIKDSILETCFLCISNSKSWHFIMHYNNLQLILFYIDENDVSWWVSQTGIKIGSFRMWVDPCKIGIRMTFPFSRNLSTSPRPSPPLF